VKNLRLKLKRVHLCNQESEAAKLNEEWCTLALKRLKEASPLALKVSLRSVSHTQKSKDLGCVCSYSGLRLFLTMLQIREGRYQTLDECLVREYRMSMNGISKQFSHEFCEVCS
jgi:3-hydroxyisobutyryl-CoA hydrolase